MERQRIIPELDVSDLKTALGFYVGVIGFARLYERSEEKFVFLDLEGAQIMLQEAAGPGRRFRTAPLEYPHGRGVNLQIEVSDAAALFDRARSGGVRAVVPLEEKWYRRGSKELGNHQFVVADPDGYLLRFYTDIGERPCGLPDFRALSAAPRRMRGMGDPLPVNFTRASR